MPGNEVPPGKAWDVIFMVLVPTLSAINAQFMRRRCQVLISTLAPYQNSRNLFVAVCAFSFTPFDMEQWVQGVVPARQPWTVACGPLVVVRL
jgi:hypothetical protein